MTRPADASFAAEIGASYIGAIFAPSPRQVTAAVAHQIFDSAPEVARVGVFGTNDVNEISRIADDLELDVVQLHADPKPDDVRAIRSGFGGDVWAVMRVDGAGMPGYADELVDAADGVLLDAKSGDRLGGAGRTIPWSDIADDLAGVRGASLVVVAGGLTPANVGGALRALAPDVVDVSSGVEHSPGVKDHQLMRDFADAVGGLEPLA